MPVIHLFAIVEETISSINNYAGTEFVPLIVNALCRAKMGLNNLMATYVTKAETVSNMKVILLNIDLTLDKHKHLISSHYAASSVLPRLPTTPIPTPVGKSDDACYGVSPILDGSDPR